NWPDHSRLAVIASTRATVAAPRRRTSEAKRTAFGGRRWGTTRTATASHPVPAGSGDRAEIASNQPRDLAISTRRWDSREHRTDAPRSAWYPPSNLRHTGPLGFPLRGNDRELASGV